MFHSLARSATEEVEISINGASHSAPIGSSVWAAMALAGDTTTRLAPVTEAPRSAYCAMGVCFECLVEIDGQPNRQACLTQVAQGMEIVTQRIVQTSQAAVGHVEPGLGETE